MTIILAVKPFSLQALPLYKAEVKKLKKKGTGSKMRWNDLSETLHTIGIFNYTEYVALWEELLQYATCHIYSTENLLCRQVVQWVCWILWAYIWQTKINDLRLCKSSYLRNISSLNGKSQHGSTAMNHRSHLQFAVGFKKGQRMKLNGSSAGNCRRD